MKTRNKQAPRRSGFTLLELLIVVVIISVLAGLILAALQRTVSQADAMAVKQELTQLETAISKFKSDFHIEPWSAIILTEDPSSTAWDSSSKSKIRRIWPQFSFTSVNDFNGDADTTDVITLTSSECLLFFLGGIRGGADGTTLRGFSKNPMNPFSAAGENRTPLYFDFDPGRFVDLDGDGMPEYRDAFGGSGDPLLYASSNNGQGYQDLDGTPAYYLQSDGSTPWKRDSYQLISPGEDGEFGFDPEPNPVAPRPVYSDTSSATGQQADNISNFTTGTTLGD